MKSRERLWNKRGVLVDLDGTLYRGETPLPGAPEWLARVRRRARVLFLTNNSSRPPAEVAARLRRMGFEADEDEVLTSAQVAARFVREAYGAVSTLVLGEKGLWEAVRREGLPAFGPGEIEPESVAVVLQGIHRRCTYADLSEAGLAVRAGARYVLTNPDRALPTERGLMPGAGALAAFIEAASGVRPVIVGKPESPMVEQALHLLNLPKDEVVMVGDNLETDIAAGNRAGVDTVLVLTGYSRAEDADSGIAKPDWILRNLSQWFA